MCSPARTCHIIWACQAPRTLPYKFRCCPSPLYGFDNPSSTWHGSCYAQVPIAYIWGVGRCHVQFVSFHFAPRRILIHDEPNPCHGNQNAPQPTTNDIRTTDRLKILDKNGETGSFNNRLDRGGIGGMDGLALINTIQGQVDGTVWACAVNVNEVNRSGATGCITVCSACPVS